MNKKILLICGISQTVITFRLSLIKSLQRNGYNVFVIALDEEYKETIIANGIEFYCVNSHNRSLNPFGMWKLQKKYETLIREIAPDIVFTFMLKPNTFGVLAAKNAGVKQIYSMVEGAGDVFINNGLKWRIIRKVVCGLYKKAFRSCAKVFFLNNDDIHKYFFKKNPIKIYACQLAYLIVTAASCAIGFYVSEVLLTVQSWLALIGDGILVLSISAFIVIATTFWTDKFKFVLSLAKKIIRRKG